MDKIEKKKANDGNAIPWWVKSIILVLFSGVICYKIKITNFNLQFDFPTFLSLALALFSVALAALFYFKATETSNSFYDNTYKFTQEIAGLLVRIESGFGEKLTHLDDAYKGICHSFEQFPNRFEGKDENLEIKKEKEQVESIIQEKDQIIDDLLNKAQLKDEEKESIISELKSKDEKLCQAQQELDFLTNRLRKERIFSTRSTIINNYDKDLIMYIDNRIMSEIDPEYVLSRPSTLVKKRFNRILNEQPPMFINDMERYGLIDEDHSLSEEGYRLLRTIAKQKVQIL